MDNESDAWRLGVDRRLALHDELLDRHSDDIRRLTDGINQLQVNLAQTATKDDVANLATRIDAAVNGLLRDALQAMPMKQSLLWGGITAIATIGMVVLEILRARGG